MFTRRRIYYRPIYVWFFFLLSPICTRRLQLFFQHVRLLSSKHGLLKHTLPSLRSHCVKIDATSYIKFEIAFLRKQFYDFSVNKKLSRSHIVHASLV